MSYSLTQWLNNKDLRVPSSNSSGWQRNFGCHHHLWHLEQVNFLLNIRIFCNYPEISSGRLLLNNCWNNPEIPGVCTTHYSVRVVFGLSRVRVGQKIPSTSRVLSTRRSQAVVTEARSSRSIAICIDHHDPAKDTWRHCIWHLSS